MNYSPDYAVTGGGMTDLEFWLNTSAQAAGSYAGAKAGATKTTAPASPFAFTVKLKPLLLALVRNLNCWWP
jgi:hypothetical protein